MTDLGIDYQPLLRNLVDDLVADGHLHSPAWVEAFSRTPRHVFVPRVLIATTDGYRVLSAQEPDAWLSMVYSDESLVTQQMPHAAGYRLPNGEAVQVPTSSSTMPSLMARMLETLDVHDEHRVLEIGTGTGYNAALLAHRLGSDRVVSIDIDPDLIETAGARLHELAHTPTLIAGDGTRGTAEYGPFDRIIATAAVPDIPLAWIEQLNPGGKILANLRGDLAGGTLCLLTKHDSDDEVIGPVLPIGGHFMWVRPTAHDPHRPHEVPTQAKRAAYARTNTELDASDLVDEEAFRFLLQLQLRGARQFEVARVHDAVHRDQRAAVVVTASDGSRAEAFAEPTSDGTRRVTQTGRRRLWDTVEATARLWQHLDHPVPERFGVVANRSTQFVWLDTDDGWQRWPLPLA